MTYSLVKRVSSFEVGGNKAFHFTIEKTLYEDESTLMEAMDEPVEDICKLFCVFNNEEELILPT